MDENIKYLQSEEKRLFELLGTLEHAYGRMHDKTREVFRDWCLISRCDMADGRNPVRFSFSGLENYFCGLVSSNGGMSVNIVDQPNNIMEVWKCWIIRQCGNC